MRTVWACFVLAGWISCGGTPAEDTAKSTSTWVSGTGDSSTSQNYSSTGHTGTTDTSVTQGDRFTVDEGGVVECVDPSLRDEQPFDTQNHPTLLGDYVRMHGAGVVVEDLTGDGRLDMVLFGTEQSDYFIQQPDGSFQVNVEKSFPKDVYMGNAFGGVAADYDGDEDLDLFVTRYDKSDYLLQNDGDGFFTDVTREALPPVVELSTDTGAEPVWAPHAGLVHRSSSAAFGDYDRDGDLDLVIGGHGFVLESGLDPSDFPPAEPSFLYRNEGDGTFTDMSHLIPDEVHEGYTFVVSWTDVDGDGWQDLYLINDLGNAYQPCRLLLNRVEEGLGFVPDNNARGLDVRVAGMGLGIADMNGDGLDDYLIPAWGRMRYMLSSPDLGVWVDRSMADGLVPDDTFNQVVGWGAELADMNNDMRMDAVVAFGFIQTRVSANTPDQPDGLWLQQEDGSFEDASFAWGFNDRGASRGLAVGDLNEDGWLDVVKPDLEGPHILKVSRCGEASWMRVRLRHPGTGNTRGVGAWVRVTTSDGVTQTRQIRAGGTGYASSSVLEAHFGLASHARVDRLEVTWPDGVMSTHLDLATRQVLTVTRGP
jgi:hypothetical protein